MRTPTAKGLAAMGTPAPYSIRKVSRAEWPGASTRASQGSSSRPPGPVSVTPVSRPSDTRRPSSWVRKRTSQPRAISSRRRAATTRRSRSVPMWGRWDQRTSSGAPAAMRVSTTAEMRGSWVPVVSLPSEKVPAPPSPNWTLDSGSSGPPAQKRSTAAARASTGSPRSSTTQGRPFRARNRAANSPAGPMPATTGGRAERRATPGKA